MSEYPKHLYRDDGADLIVPNADSERQATADGFGNDPAAYLARRSGSIVPHVQTSGKDDLAERVATRVMEMMDERERVALDQPAGDQPSTDAAPRRGRPPGSRNRSIEEDNTNGE